MRSMTEQQQQPDEHGIWVNTEPHTAGARRWIWYAVGAGTAMVVAVILALVFVLSGGAPEDGARTACEQFVKDAIKTPSTAKFPAGASVETNPVGAYVVTGQVDAQNGFGATVRQTYTCIVSEDGDGWELHNLDGLS